jgi:hypothetical protein
MTFALRDKWLLAANAASEGGHRALQVPVVCACA